MGFNYLYQPKQDFSVYSAGKLIQSIPGATGFPVRLASELFMRYISYSHPTAKVTIWDPCCGAGQLLTTIGLIHTDYVEKLIGTDIDSNILELTEKNFQLFSPGGIASRCAEIERNSEVHNKIVLADILQSLQELRMQKNEINIGTCARKIDIFDLLNLKEISQEFTPELIFLDAPYGNMTELVNHNLDSNSYEVTINNLQKSITIDTFCILVCQEKKLNFDSHVRQIQKFKIGKRIIRFLLLQSE